MYRIISANTGKGEAHMFLAVDAYEWRRAMNAEVSCICKHPLMVKIIFLFSFAVCRKFYIVGEAKYLALACPAHYIYTRLRPTYVHRYRGRLKFVHEH